MEEQEYAFFFPLTQSAVQKLTASAKLYPWLKPLW